MSISDRILDRLEYQFFPLCGAYGLLNELQHFDFDFLHSVFDMFSHLTSDQKTHPVVDHLLEVVDQAGTHILLHKFCVVPVPLTLVTIASLTFASPVVS